jgi:hypothetical protein
MDRAHFYALGVAAWKAGNHWLSSCPYEGWRGEAYKDGMWAAREGRA